MLRGTKEFLYSTLGAVMLLAAGCANEPPASPAPAETSSTGTIPTPAAGTGAPKAEPNAPTADSNTPKTVDSATSGVTDRAVAPPQAAKPAPKTPKAPKPPAAPELPASSVLQEGGKTTTPPKESNTNPNTPAAKMVDPPTVGAGPAKPDGERAAPMLSEPIAPPTISAESVEETHSPAVPEKRMESNFWAPPTLSEPLHIQKEKDAQR